MYFCCNYLLGIHKKGTINIFFENFDCIVTSIFHKGIVISLTHLYFLQEPSINPKDMASSKLTFIKKNQPIWI